MFLSFFFHVQFDHQLPWLTTKHNDGLETTVVVKQRFAYAELIRSSKLTRAFYARVKNTGFRCVSIKRNPAIVLQTDALGRSSMSEATDF